MKLNYLNKIYQAYHNIVQNRALSYQKVMENVIILIVINICVER